MHPYQPEIVPPCPTSLATAIARPHAATRRSGVAAGPSENVSGLLDTSGGWRSQGELSSWLMLVFPV